MKAKSRLFQRAISTTVLFGLFSMWGWQRAMAIPTDPLSTTAPGPTPTPEPDPGPPTFAGDLNGDGLVDVISTSKETQYDTDFDGDTDVIVTPNSTTRIDDEMGTIVTATDSDLDTKVDVVTHTEAEDNGDVVSSVQVQLNADGTTTTKYTDADGKNRTETNTISW